MAEPTPKLRRWFDSCGALRIVAEFRGVIDGKVKLKRRNGAEILVPLEMLSEADQSWIKKHAQSAVRE